VALDGGAGRGQVLSQVDALGRQVAGEHPVDRRQRKCVPQPAPAVAGATSDEVPAGNTPWLDDLGYLKNRVV
jgi:hypothetical protein